MSASVLLVGDAGTAPALLAALADFEVTVTDSPEHARALASTGAFLCVLSARGANVPIDGAIELEVGSAPDDIVQAVHAAVTTAVAALGQVAQTDVVGALTYDEYVELARHVATRRYLLALLCRHCGNVTEAARGANLKRESLHRLLRRYRVTAGGFRGA